MQQGDFTHLAQNYIHRTGYSPRVLKALACYLGAYRDEFRVADVGAGTGKLTENLSELGLSGYAIEPNDAMREEGMRLLAQSPRFIWSKGTGEATGLPDSCVDWVLMASSFHWTAHEKSLAEFWRILRPGGFFTALWNPRDLERSALHQQIEKRIQAILPDLRRVSSGSREYTQDLADKLVSTAHFGNLLFMEAPHEVAMSQERYLGAWKSVNDIQAQAGELFPLVLSAIEAELAGQQDIVVPYKTRAWTVQSHKGLR